MDIAQQLLKGDKEIDRMRDEIYSVFNIIRKAMIVADTEFCDKIFYHSTKISDELSINLMIEKQSFAWIKGYYIWVLHPEYRCKTKIYWNEISELDKKFVQVVYEGLYLFVEDIFRLFPKVENELKPLLDASI